MQCRCGTCVDGTCVGSCAHAVGGDPPGPVYGTDLAPEHAYWIAQCPEERSSLVATTCDQNTTFDTVLYLLGPGTGEAERQHAVNDDLCPIPSALRSGGGRRRRVTSSAPSMSLRRPASMSVLTPGRSACRSV